MNKTAKLYTLITQGFIQIFVLIFVGYKLGTSWWLDSTAYGALFAGIGAIIGVILMITTLLKAGDIFDKRKNVQ